MSDFSLDEPQSYSRLDPDDMYRRVADLPAQIEDAWNRAQALSLPGSTGAFVQFWSQVWAAPP